MKIKVSRSACLAIEMVRMALAHESVHQRLKRRWSKFDIAMEKEVVGRRIFSMKIWFTGDELNISFNPIYINGWALKEEALNYPVGELDIELGDFDPLNVGKKKYHFLFNIGKFGEFTIHPEMTLVESKD